MGDVNSKRIPWLEHLPVRAVGIIVPSNVLTPIENYYLAELKGSLIRICLKDTILVVQSGADLPDVEMVPPRQKNLTTTDLTAKTYSI